MKAKAQKSKGRTVIVGTNSGGLWYGQVRQRDADILRVGIATIYGARHVRYWYGRTGGISSLAAYGPCGPRAAESRIGAPDPATSLSCVAAVHTCSDEAIAAFAAIEAK